MNRLMIWWKGKQNLTWEDYTAGRAVFRLTYQHRSLQKQPVALQGYSTRGVPAAVLLTSMLMPGAVRIMVFRSSVNIGHLERKRWVGSMAHESEP